MYIKVFQKNHDKSCKIFQLQNYLPMANMINAKKTDLFDIIWKFATLFKIYIENGQINTTKNCKIFKWS